MKRLIACVTGLLLVCVVEAGAREHSLVPGMWALQFGIASDFTVGAFTAGSVAMKRQLSNRSALRVALEIDGSSGKATFTDPREEEDKSFNSDLDTRVAAMYQGYLTPGADVAAFWGAGGFVSYAEDSDESKRSDGRRQMTHLTRWRTGMTFGVGGEWFATRTISFHAEYNGEAFYHTTDEWRTFKVPGSAGTRASTDRSGWVFDLASRAIFGLSLYF